MFLQLPVNCIDQIILLIGPDHAYFLAATCRDANAHVKNVLHCQTFKTPRSVAYSSLSILKLDFAIHRRDQHLFDNCAKAGNLEVVRYLHGKRYEVCTDDAMDWAACNGHLATVRWLHKNRHEGCTDDAMDGAAENGHLEMVRWLHENRQEGCTDDTMDWAAANGHLATARYLREIS